MGCGQKAVHEDEEEWDDFKAQHLIGMMRWGVYSKEATYAKQGASLPAGLMGDLLIRYVALMLDRDEQSAFKAAEAKERAEYERLHKKYGNN